MIITSTIVINHYFNLSQSASQPEISRKMRLSSFSRNLRLSRKSLAKCVSGQSLAKCVSAQSLANCVSAQSLAKCVSTQSLANCVSSHQPIWKSLVKCVSAQSLTKCISSKYLDMWPKWAKLTHSDPTDARKSLAKSVSPCPTQVRRNLSFWCDIKTVILGSYTIRRNLWWSIHPFSQKVILPLKSLPFGSCTCCLI